MEIEAVIFDFGDTLASLNPTRENIIQQYLRGKGIMIGLKEIRTAYRIVGYHHKHSEIKIKSEDQHKEYLVNMNIELLKAMGLSLNGKAWSAEIYQYFSARKKWTLFADVVPTLRTIRKMKIRTAILANWNIHLKKLVEEIGLDAYCDRIYSSAELGMEKPDPRVFKHVIRIMRLFPPRTIYVGNEYETDVIGSREAGLLPALVDRFNLWPQADCIRIRNIADLGPWIQLGKIS